MASARRKQEDFHYLKTMCETDSRLEYRCFDLYDEDKNDKEWLIWVARAQPGGHGHIWKKDMR